MVRQQFVLSTNVSERTGNNRSINVCKVYDLDKQKIDNINVLIPFRNIDIQELLAKIGYEEQTNVYIPFIFLYFFHRKMTFTLTKKELKLFFSERNEKIKDIPPIEFVLCMPYIHTSEHGYERAAFKVPNFVVHGQYGDLNKLVSYFDHIGYKYDETKNSFMSSGNEIETKAFIDYLKPFSIEETHLRVTDYDLLKLLSHNEMFMDITLINADERVTELLYELFPGQFSLNHELPFGELQESIDSFPDRVSEEDMAKVVIAFDTSNSVYRNRIFSRLKKYSSKEDYQVYLFSESPSLLAYGLSIKKLHIFNTTVYQIL